MPHAIAFRGRVKARRLQKCIAIPNIHTTTFTPLHMGRLEAYGVKETAI